MNANPNTNPTIWTLDGLQRDPKLAATRNGRQTVAGIIRRITKRNKRTEFRASASVGGSVCPRCHAWFTKYQARNAHRRTTCAGGAK